jgi:hypothetical protein
MYRHVASSITSSAVRATGAEEDSATSAVGGGSRTSTGEGTGISMSGRRLVIAVTWVGSDAGGITTLRFSDDGRAAGSSSTITTASSRLGPALVGETRAAQEAGAPVAVSPSTTVAAGTGGGGAIDASVAVAATGTSSACGGTSSVLGGWNEAQKKSPLRSAPGASGAPG